MTLELTRELSAASVHTSMVHTIVCILSCPRNLILSVF